MMQDLEPLYSHEDDIPVENDKAKETRVLRGRLWRSNDGCGWQLDGVDLQKFLAQYHTRKVMLVIAPIDAAPQVEPKQTVCSTCGFPLDDLGECLRCQWYRVVRARQRREELFQEIDRIVEQSWAEPHA